MGAKVKDMKRGEGCQPNPTRHYDSTPSPSSGGNDRELGAADSWTTIYANADSTKSIVVSEVNVGPKFAFSSGANPTRMVALREEDGNVFWRGFVQPDDRPADGSPQGVEFGEFQTLAPGKALQGMQVGTGNAGDVEVSGVWWLEDAT